MKKLFFFLIVCSLLFPSCATILGGGTKKNIFLVDLPKDLKVYDKKGKPVEIKDQLIGSDESGSTRNSYYYPGVRMKLKKGMSLKLESEGKTTTVPLKVIYKPRDVFFSALFNLLNLEVGFVIDLADGALKSTQERFIDVPAVLKKEKPRDQKKLHKIAKGLD